MSALEESRSRTPLSRPIASRGEQRCEAAKSEDAKVAAPSGNLLYGLARFGESCAHRPTRLALTESPGGDRPQRRYDAGEMHRGSRGSTA